jgi:hypothetical protein
MPFAMPSSLRAGMLDSPTNAQKTRFLKTRVLVPADRVFYSKTGNMALQSAGGSA